MTVLGAEVDMQTECLETAFTTPGVQEVFMDSDTNFYQIHELQMFSPSLWLVFS